MRDARAARARAFESVELHHAHVDGLLLALDHDVLALLATTFPCAYERTKIVGQTIS